MTLRDSWGLFADHWTKSLTMVLGSFVAGSTPAGGGAVAFPIFTKALGVPTGEARTFGLLIQSVGMSMATIFILSRGIPVYGRALAFCLPAGVIGLLAGTFVLHPPDPLPRLVFTSVAVVFGVVLMISHWGMRWVPDEGREPVLTFGHGGWLLALAGALGGVLASMVGSGIDVLAFIVMVLALGMHERRAIPTSVVAMASLSLVGVATRLLAVDGGIEPAVWDYWLVCVPVVSLGAPLGALVASRIHRDWLILGLLGLIAADVASTVWIVDFSAARLGLMVATGAVAAACFGVMLRWRRLRIGR